KSKKFIISAIVIVLAIIIAASMFGGKDKKSQYETAVVEKGNLAQTVDATGKIQSADTLALHFQVPGVVASVGVREGQNVARGQWLANLSLAELDAAVSQARASLNQKLAGATAEQIAAAQQQVNSAETALFNARKNLETTTEQQETLINNALRSVLNAGLAASPDEDNLSTIVPAITGVYYGTAQGQYVVSLYSTSAGMRFATTGLETTTGVVSTLTPIQLGTKGLYIQFPSLPPNYSDTWVIFLPNTAAPAYLASLNAYNAAKETQTQALLAAQTAIDSASAALDLQKANYDSLVAKPRDVDTAYYQAALDQALASRAKAIITAPISGEISKIYKKQGELVSSAEPMIELLSPHFEIEVDVPETDVIKLQIGDNAVITLDALGTDVKFGGTVVSIEPSSTEIQDVVYYKVILSLNENSNITIKSGMTANVLVNTDTRENVLFVPSRAILTKNNGDEKYIRVLGDDNKITEKTVVLGLKADGGLTEILSGVNEGDTVVLKILGATQ
ncbi:MAG: efflux RND transporter periplasmic adaptor subunit, partial [Chitinivibrionales bacterium]|nr:efflux RND transporter periplasmic adaptor subunit [Chitinivibrionales bacterium]